MGGETSTKLRVPKATLNRFEPVRALTNRFIVQRGTTEPANKTDNTFANLCKLCDTLINVINAVARPDSKGIH